MRYSQNIDADIVELLRRAREALQECADDLRSDVDMRWRPNGVVHPVNERRYRRDLKPVGDAQIVIAHIDAVLSPGQSFRFPPEDEKGGPMEPRA